jgi:hypothetical protein
MPPPKVDTRKKTRKQKEKNRRRKKTEKARKRVTFVPGKGQSFTNRLRRLFSFQSKKPDGGGGSAKVKLRLRSRPSAEAAGAEAGAVGTHLPKTRRIPRQSMQAIRGIVANAYASRMPVGSNHTKGIYANTQTGLSSKNFFKRTLREMRRAQNPNYLPPTYSYQNRPRVNPQVHVQPAGLAEPSKSLHNALRAVPAASMPRGHRQSLLREAHAAPIGTGLAEPGIPDWGRMYEATESGRRRVTRARTQAEQNKEDAYQRLEADRKTGGPGAQIGIWAPSRVRRPENNGALVVANGSVSSRESARRDGRRRLSAVEEHTFLQHYPHERTDMLAAAKIPGPEGQLARAEIRRMTNAVFSNSNSSLSGNTESYLDASPSESELEFQRTMMARMTTLTADEVQRLRNLGLEHMIPAANASQLDRQVAIGEIRDVLADFDSNSNEESNGSRSTIHTQEMIDPLHLSVGEILLLRRQGPEGADYIRRATMSADQQIVMDQVAEAREFLRIELERSRSGSRDSIHSAPLPASDPGQAYLNMHAAAFPETHSPESSISSLGLLGSSGSSGSNHSFHAQAPTLGHPGQAYLNMHAAAFPELPLTHSPESSVSSLGLLGSSGSNGSNGSRSSRGSRRS